MGESENDKKGRSCARDGDRCHCLKRRMCKTGMAIMTDIYRAVNRRFPASSSAACNNNSHAG